MNEQDRDRISKERAEDMRRMKAQRGSCALYFYIFVGIILPLLVAMSVIVSKLQIF